MRRHGLRGSLRPTRARGMLRVTWRDLPGCPWSLKIKNILINCFSVGFRVEGL